MRTLKRSRARTVLAIVGVLACASCSSSSHATKSPPTAREPDPVIQTIPALASPARGPSEIAHVSGHVRWASGAPATNVVLVLERVGVESASAPERWVTPIETADGAFAVSVAPGEYELCALRKRTGARERIAFPNPREPLGELRTYPCSSPPTRIHAPAANVDVVVDPGQPITCVVRDEDGVEVDDAQLLAWDADAFRISNGPQLTRSYEGRALEWSGLLPGNWLISATNENHAPSLTRRIDVDGTRITLELVLRRYATVEGRVVDPEGRGVADARVRPIYLTGSAWSFDAARSEGRTDADGRYRLERVIPETIELSIDIGSTHFRREGRIEPASGEQLTGIDFIAD